MRFSRDYQILLLLLLLSLVVRAISLHDLLIDHDESTYIVIAQSILQGHTYWIDYIDTKPVGIFLLFAGVEALFGYAIIPIRIFTSLIVGGTGFLIYAFVRQMEFGKFPAITGGVAYILMISLISFYGLAPNTEIFFNFFTAFALFGVVCNRNIWSFLLAGMCIGFGFIIKPVVVFDIAAIAIFIAFFRGNFRSQALAKTTTFLAGSVIPFASVALYYFLTDAFDQFLFYSFEVGGRYLSETSIGDSALFILDFLGRYIPFTVPFVLFLFSKNVVPNRLKYFMLLWCVLVWTGILLPGKNFGHYTIHFMLPFSIAIGLFYTDKSPRDKIFKYPALAAIAYMLVSLVLQFDSMQEEVERPAVIAKYLNRHLDPGEEIFTSDATQTIYILTDRLPPTPYVHKGLLESKEHIYTLDIDTAEAYRELWSNPDLEYILDKVDGDDIVPDKLFRPDTVILGVQIFERRE